jgi:alpha-tubulin suppressor-like RCC1 family protein
VNVTGLGSGVTAVAAGGSHALAVQDGVVYAWGDNGNGQLGDGNTTNTNTPVAVSGLGSGVTALAGGAFHSLAIKDGGVYAWGYNLFFQLGQGLSDRSDHSTPVAVPGLSSGVTAIAAGGYESFAIDNGALYGWGDNDRGQIGDGTTNNVVSPELIPGMTSGVTAVSAGVQFTLAIKNGALYGWGYNGLAGFSGSSDSVISSPVALGLTSGVTAVAASIQFSLAVQNGHVFSFGSNYEGELGIAGDNGGATPQEVDPADLNNIVSVVVANSSGYALSADGSVWTWGDNSFGELGLNSYTTPFSTPQHLVAPQGFEFTALDADPSGNFVVAIVAPVPEPGCCGLALLGGGVLFALVILKRRGGVAGR